MAKKPKIKTCVCDGCGAKKRIVACAPCPKTWAYVDIPLSTIKKGPIRQLLCDWCRHRESLKS